ncbi:hypothetical protein Ddc_10106 [Ditylenchus destructor]|nr:hypothetical protein Ddc_10106 [Ditylenchus destructor]
MLVPTVTISILVAYSIASFVLYVLALPLELEKVKYCQSQSCLLTRFNGTNPIQYIRLVTMAVNFCVSGYLLWIFRSVGNKEKLNNRAVKMNYPENIVKRHSKRGYEYLSYGAQLQLCQSRRPNAISADYIEHCTLRSVRLVHNGEKIKGQCFTGIHKNCRPAQTN